MGCGVADAQHANPRYAAELALLAQRHGALWETRDFDVPLDELLRRNAARDTADRVPEDYIRSSQHFPPRCSARWNQADPNGNLLERMRADPLRSGYSGARRNRRVCVQFPLQRAFREHRWTDRTHQCARAFYRRQRSGGATRVREVLCCGRDGGDIVRPKSSITLKNIQSRCPCALSARRTDFSGSWARRELLDCSASGRSRQTDYSALIERPFPSDSAVRAELWRMLHEWNVTAAFEVIDRESDRHIVGYESSGLRLLHLIRNARIVLHRCRSRGNVHSCRRLRAAGNGGDLPFAGRSRPGNRRRQGQARMKAWCYILPTVGW